MKKLLFSLLAIVLVSFNGNAINGSVKTEPVSNKIEDLGKVKVKLTLGRQSRDCKGFGVCGFSVTYTDQILGVDVEAEIISIGTTQRIACTVPDKSLQTIKNHFGQNSLILEEDYVLDATTAKTLGFSTGYTIKKGTYDIIYDSKTQLQKVIL